MRNSSLARLFVFILILNLIIPLFVIGNTNQSKLKTDGLNIDSTSLKTQVISKDDFSPLIENRDDNDLGNITINNMDFSGYDELGFYLNNAKYPTLPDDYNEEALNMTFVNMEFIETLEPAIKDNVLPVIQYQPQISVKLNETIEVRYNTTKSSSDGFLVYCPRLYPCEFIELHVQEEGSTDLKQVNPGNYSIDEYDFLRFNYVDFFPGEDILNFSMYIIWIYNITIVDDDIKDDEWQIVQDGSHWVYINEPNQDVELLYTYDFTIKGEKYQGESYNPDDHVKVSGIVANFSIIIPDRNLLNYKYLIINSTSQTIKLNADNSISTGFMELNESHFFLNFTAQFTIEFVDTVGKYWAIDRLVSDSSIRERIYLANISSGPEYLSVAWLMVQENSFNNDQITDKSCLFEERNSLLYTINYNRSLWEEDPDYISDNPREREWTNISLPYFIKNEICPLVIRYNATEDLAIRIYDNIGMPLIGLEVVVDYQDKPFGTYISKDQSQPFSSQTTDINAEIVINSVPLGEFVIHIYQYGLYQGTFTVNSYVEVNSITTGIIHFPVWILIFGLINLFILALGYNFYRKNKIRDQ